MNRFSAIAIFIFVLSCTACVERNLLLPEEFVPAQLVVLAYLADGVRAEVYVSKLLPFSQDSIEFGMPNAEVSLYKDGVIEARLHHIATTDCGAPDSVCVFGSSKHISDDTLYLDYGSSYHIEVKASGFPTVYSEPITATRHVNSLYFDLVKSDTTSIFSRPAMVIDTMWLRYDFLGNVEDQVYLYADNSSFTVRPEYDNRNQVLYDPRYSYALPLSTLNNDLQRFTRPGSTLNGYGADALEYPFSLHIARYPIDYIRFIDLIQSQDNDVSGIYATSPVPIPTNMVDGEGYFVIIEHYNLGQFDVE